MIRHPARPRPVRQRHSVWPGVLGRTPAADVCITDAASHSFTPRQEDRRTVMTADAASSLTNTLNGVFAAELDCTMPMGYQHFWCTVRGKLRKYQYLGYTVFGLGVAASFYFAAWRLHGNSPSNYRIDNQWSAWTGLFILALAIERALEPFSRKLGPDTDKAKAREDQDAIEMCRRLTAIVTWGVATGLAFLLCTKLNITLMQAVRANDSGQPPFWADLLVTGLVVGAGTKPLHDLVSNIERVKNGKQDPS